MNQWLALQNEIGNTAVTRLIQQSRHHGDALSVQRTEPGPAAHAPAQPASRISTFTAGDQLVAFVPVDTAAQQLASYLARVPAGSVVVLQRPVMGLAATAVEHGFHVAYPAGAGEAHVEHDRFTCSTGWVLTTPAGATHDLDGRNLTLRTLGTLPQAAAGPAPTEETVQPDSPGSDDRMDWDSFDDDYILDAATPSRASSVAPGVLTEDEAQQYFDLVRAGGFITSTGATEQIPWDQIEDGCSQRAHLTARRLLAAGVPCRRIFAVCTADPEEVDSGLRVASETAGDGRPGQPAMVGFGFHTAVTVQVQLHGGGVEERVFDPAIESGRPIGVTEWLTAMHVEEEDIRPLGQSHAEVVQALHTMPDDVPQNDEGYPEDLVSVFSLEPEVYHYPKVHPISGQQLHPEHAPPAFTMEHADAAYLADRHVLEEQVRESRRRRSQHR